MAVPRCRIQYLLNDSWRHHGSLLLLTFINMLANFLILSDNQLSFMAIFMSEWNLGSLRRRRLQKRHLKSEFALLETLSRLFHLV